MKDILMRYAIAMVIGILVTLGLIYSREDFANPNMYKVGIVVVFFYFTGLTALVIDEIRRGR